jgi:2-C-methyl-D-erythritol 4-phosphate cytidylyltransferase
MEQTGVGIVIVAAGSGRRMEAEKNKIFLPLDGIPILMHTLQVFFNAFSDCECILAIKQEDELEIKRLLERESFYENIRFVYGGKERQNSVFNALQALSPKLSIILIHDAARPLVSVETIKRCFEQALSEEASCVGVPVKDTIKQVDSRGCIQRTLGRSVLWSAQTPQGFSRNIIFAAHQKANEDNFIGTDDAMLAERMGIQVSMVCGNPENIKITTTEDLVVAEMIIKQMNS